MATLTAIRAGFEATLRTVLGTGTEIYNRVPGSPVLPCVCLVPAEIDFVVAMQRGTDTYEFDVLVLVPSADEDVAQELLDQYVTGAGGLSIRQAVYNANNGSAGTGLGVASTNAHISAMTSYGGQFEAVGVDHVGASLRLIVHTKGTE